MRADNLGTAISVSPPRLNLLTCWATTPLWKGPAMGPENELAPVFELAGTKAGLQAASRSGRPRSWCSHGGLNMRTRNLEHRGVNMAVCDTVGMRN